MRVIAGEAVIGGIPFKKMMKIGMYSTSRVFWTANSNFAMILGSNDPYSKEKKNSRSHDSSHQTPRSIESRPVRGATKRHMGIIIHPIIILIDMTAKRREHYT